MKIIAAYNLPDLFPRSTYKNVKGAALHYQLAYCDTKGIESCLSSKTWQKNKAQWVNLRAQKGVTPLHVCIITHNFSVAKRLLSLQANPRIPDQEGWTPLHHLALAEEEIEPELRKDCEEIKQIFLKQFPDLQNQKTAQGLTYGEIHHLMQRKCITGEIPHLYIEKEGQKVRCTGTLFKEIIGVDYADGYWIKPYVFAQMWKKGFEEIKYLYEREDRNGPFMGTASFFTNLYQTQNLLSFCKPDFLIQQSPSKGYCLKAASPINSGTFISFYDGELFSELSTSVSDIEYGIGNVTASNLRTSAAMISDGIPNCAVRPVFLPKESFYRRGLFAIAPIKAGEELLFNYGAGHIVKRNRYVLPPLPKALQLFNNSNKLFERATFLGSLSHISDIQEIERIYLTSNLAYLVETPLIPAFLYLAEKISFEQFSNFFSDVSTFIESLETELSEDAEGITSEFLKLYPALHEFEKRVEKEENSLKEVRKFLCAQLLRASVATTPLFFDLRYALHHDTEETKMIEGMEKRLPRVEKLFLEIVAIQDPDHKIMDQKIRQHLEGRLEGDDDFIRKHPLFIRYFEESVKKQAAI